MSQVVTIPFTESFLEYVGNYIDVSYIKPQKDLSRLAIVFGGRRPSLFIKRDLAQRLDSAYVPPQFFTIDDWMGFVSGEGRFLNQSPLDHCYVIYELALKICPEVLKGREVFAQFLPWAKEILNFVEQLDLEDVPLDALKLIESHAKIGYSVPEDINRLLTHLCDLRKGYHDYLNFHQWTTRGYQYLQASRSVSQVNLSAFDEVLFCNFFYLHRTEEIVIKNIYQRHPTILFMQGDERRWPALQRVSKSFGTPVLEGKEVVPTNFNLKIYEAIDQHMQAGLVKNIINQQMIPEETVVVLPNPDSLLPLLTAIGGQLEEFNVSMGYPLKRSALYALLEAVIEAQLSRKDGLYYSRDYLKLLQHPLAKNLSFTGNVMEVRILIHTLEEALKGVHLTSISGSLFLDLDEVFKDETLWQRINDKGLKEALGLIHEIFFKNFQEIHCPLDLSKALDRFLVFMQEHSVMERFPLNTQIARRLQQIAEEFSQCQFREEEFPSHELFRILQERLSAEMVAFTGSPLRGLQILGLFETRSLNFKNVIIIDVNEGVLPNLRIYEPLIPREVMIKLSLDRLELEEEIQRYGFMRLISSASNIHLVYLQNQDKVRSRFIEELIWEQEQRQKSIGTVEIFRGEFESSVHRNEKFIPKTKEIIAFLESFRFSASSINTYMRNPYDFYLQYVLGLKERDDLLENLQSRHIGTFIHNLFEKTFKVFLGKKPVIDESFKKYFYKIYESDFNQTFSKSRRSDTFLMETVLRTRLDRFLKEEAKRCQEVEKVLYIERKFEHYLKFINREVRFTYRVDRVDQMQDGTILILDYKTGSIDPMPKSSDNLKLVELNRVNVRDQVYSFQMPLYAQYLIEQYPGQPVDAALYHLRTMELNYFLHKRPLEEIKETLEIYQQALEVIIEELFNIEVPFINDPSS